MNLHEYQSKILMKGYGLPVSEGRLCHQADEVESAYTELGGGLCVVKAQVHAGGRGKAGGVKLVRSASEAREAGQKILGMKLVTPQTGREGKLVRKVYIEKGCDIAKEYYLSLLVDRGNRAVAIIASTEGGMEIEKVAHEAPEKIIKVAIDPAVGLQNFECLDLMLKLGLDLARKADFCRLMQSLYRLVLEKDLSLVEINPFVVKTDGSFLVLDAKCSVDDNALFRHPDLRELRDVHEENPDEVKASDFGLNYISLDGNIGCMVNGAGLAMATMDIIKLSGGQPANFLDVGGGASKETVTEAFKILCSDSRVKGILVNILGGIVRCDVIADGIVAAAKEVGVNVPLVVRLQGTNVTQGRKILADSGLNITPAEKMDEAARKVIDAAGGSR